MAVYCGPYLLISVYVSPNLGLNDFNTTLDEIAEAVNQIDKLIVGGDFNAKSALWSS